MVADTMQYYYPNMLKLFVLYYYFNKWRIFQKKEKKKYCQRKYFKKYYIKEKVTMLY